MQLNPTFAKACVRDGHEIATHGLRWLDIWEYDLQADREYITKSLLALKEVTGEMPVGCYYGRGTPNTKGLFPEAWRDAGGEMLYCSEAYNDDVPYWLDLPAERSLKDEEKKGMLIVPYNYDVNGEWRWTYQVQRKLANSFLDGKFHMSPGFVGSDMYEKYLKATFDMLYREGGKMMNIPMHRYAPVRDMSTAAYSRSRIVGKPGRSEALRNFMKYIQEKDGVWVTTRREIATHFKDKFPYKSGHRA